MSTCDTQLKRVVSFEFCRSELIKGFSLQPNVGFLSFFQNNLII